MLNNQRKPGFRCKWCGVPWHTTDKHDEQAHAFNTDQIARLIAIARYSNARERARAAGEH